MIPLTTVTEPPLSRTEPVDPRDPLVRLTALLDHDSLSPLAEPDRSGTLAVRGRVHGIDVIAYCTDGAIMGGAMGIDGCQRIVTAIDLAVDEELPVIGVWHSGGARLAEGVEALHGVGLVFAAMIRASGKVPQVSVVVGPAAGGAAYGPALTDVVVMSPRGRVFVTGPDVVRSVTGEQIDQEALGGAEAHGKKSGVVHVVATDEFDAYARARRITELLSDGGPVDPDLLDLDSIEPAPDPAAHLPKLARRAYDVKPVLRALIARDHMHGAVGIDQREAGGIGKGRPQVPADIAVHGGLGLDRQAIGLGEGRAGGQAEHDSGAGEIANFHFGRLPFNEYWILWRDDARPRCAPSILRCKRTAPKRPPSRQKILGGFALLLRH